MPRISAAVKKSKVVSLHARFINDRRIRLVLIKALRLGLFLLGFAQRSRGMIVIRPFL
jgi:hypothetical protein